MVHKITVYLQCGSDLLTAWSIYSVDLIYCLVVNKITIYSQCGSDLLTAWWLIKSESIYSEIPVSQFGLVVRHQAGKQMDLGSIPLQLSSLFQSCGLWMLK